MRYLTLIILIIFPGLSSGQDSLIRISGYTQGTTYTVLYHDGLSRDFRKEIGLLLEEINHSFSLYDTNSVLSAINRNDTAVSPGKHILHCFKQAMEIAEQTQGAFDITVGTLVRAWGFGRGGKAIPDTALVDSIMTFTGYHLVHLDGDRIIKADGRLRLDCNGIAQGYTVDVISGFLAAQGVEHFLVEVGGEVFAKNTKPDGSPWKVGIEKPDGSGMHAGGELVIVKLLDRALSTSGNYRKYFIHNGRKYSHTINPQTGFPAMNNLLSATVCAADCLSADAYATAFMVMGLDKASAFLQRHPEFSAYLIYADENGTHQVYMTEAFREMLAKTGAEP